MRLVAAFLALFAWAVPLQAEEKIERLMQALQLDAVITILRDEGNLLGQDLQQTFLDDNGGPVFLDQVDRIYDADKMRSQVKEVFEEALTESQMERAILFFESDLGQDIISLELSARVAMADETIEEMAQDAYEQGDRSTELFRLVDEYIQVNNLIDENVQNSISADFNFFRGMTLGAGADDGELLAQLLEEKDSVTEDTRTWLYSFFLLAYKPLSDSQMRENIAFSRTETGRAINTALFESFDRMFDTIYYQLGLAVAQVLKGSDL
ncbi:hypothetical protein RUE5091_01552 [Ruegeria denitrificans]|uniref:DUF2059 domain-containing protein n=1 Tax=Ruegeria denitrificans TaxID=1715692 RepID=A0A0P1IQ90_9RHOB|nr:DUF2059 domain-containing protein [Ruegeria denitrificans]CUJ95541.1 hypothetical protein RUE5091_01552 [Ruegeria denitrificans]